MSDNKKPGVGKLLATGLTWAAVLYLLMLILGWLLERKWGAILITVVLWYVGSVLIIGALLSVITGQTYADDAWFWWLCGPTAVVAAAVQWTLLTLDEKKP